MKGDKIHYKEGYKYQLVKDYTTETNIRPKYFIRSKFVRLDIDGFLYIFYGYAWDGASGPAIDCKKNMRASLIHDALSQLAREGYLNAKEHKEAIDEEFYKVLREDGMWSPRIAIDAAGLMIAGTSYLEHRKDEILEAP